MAISAPDDLFNNRLLRLADMNKESHRMLPPISGYENKPLVRLEDAVEPLIALLPNIQQYAYVAKQKCTKPANGLTPDESAAIMVYSIGWEPLDQCLNVALNAALRSEDRRNLRPWSLFLKLFLTALSRLPSISHKTVYRATKVDLHTEYQEGNTVVWWGFSSCATSMSDLKSEKFLGKTGSKTIFCIECYSGKNIREHSYYSSEDEILLLPGTQFQVVSCIRHSSDLHLIQLRETQPSFPLMASISHAPSLQESFLCEKSIPYSSLKASSKMVDRARGFEIIEIDTTVPKDGSETETNQ